jgi:hypothetical protein
MVNVNFTKQFNIVHTMIKYIMNQAAGGDLVPHHTTIRYLSFTCDG